ncbi:NADH-quinone oxidoreductase subunit N [Catelliglobosispora koreensis]|uniref:NADH-quinone oxidoreductase subunit N n=1 Tax=Catelliglobosispora koreensis TaxID=129052 RepID=UPI000372735B|nr:proton-conducting transporter membrane subunit [Catelliglobosispora koreensis]
MIWPLLIAAGTAVAVLLFDVVFPRWYVPLTVAVAGSLAVAGVSAWAPLGTSRVLCAASGQCSFVYDHTAALVSVLFGLLTAFALLLLVPALREGDSPAGEMCFLLACAMTGGVVLGGSRDLVTIIIALETLTLPLYALVALHKRRAPGGASGAVTFFTTSIVATAVTLLGAALVNLASGQLHLPEAFAPSVGKPLVLTGLVLMLTGLGFKVAAVPLHAWAPSTYDGAPVPIAAYLSTASKLGGVIAILLVTDAAVKGGLAYPAGLTLAVLATASLVVGTLVALRQDRTVRLLAWSSVAQAGFILAPLAGLAVTVRPELFAASLAYTLFFIVLELGAFSGVMSLRPAAASGGVIGDLRGLGRSAPWRGATLAFALIGLAGLPPALVGLFAKITILRALIDAGTFWLAVVVALVSVVGLAVYWRPLAQLYRTAPDDRPARSSWAIYLPLAVATAAAGALTVLPQLALDLARWS